LRSLPTSRNQASRNHESEECGLGGFCPEHCPGICCQANFWWATVTHPILKSLIWWIGWVSGTLVITRCIRSFQDLARYEEAERWNGGSNNTDPERGAGIKCGQMRTPSGPRTGLDLSPALNHATTRAAGSAYSVANGHEHAGDTALSNWTSAADVIPRLPRLIIANLSAAQLASTANREPAHTFAEFSDAYLALNDGKHIPEWTLRPMTIIKLPRKSKNYFQKRARGLRGSPNSPRPLGARLVGRVATTHKPPDPGMRQMDDIPGARYSTTPNPKLAVGSKGGGMSESGQLLPSVSRQPTTPFSRRALVS